MPGSLSAGNFREKLVLAYKIHQDHLGHSFAFHLEPLNKTPGVTVDRLIYFEGIPFSKLQRVGDQCEILRVQHVIELHLTQIEVTAIPDSH